MNESTEDDLQNDSAVLKKEVIGWMNTVVKDLFIKGLHLHFIAKSTI